MLKHVNRLGFEHVHNICNTAGVIVLETITKRACAISTHNNCKLRVLLRQEQHGALRLELLRYRRLQNKHVRHILFVYIYIYIYTHTHQYTIHATIL